jgi:hypothetical protein
VRQAEAAGQTGRSREKEGRRERGAEKAVVKKPKFTEEVSDLNLGDK